MGRINRERKLTVYEIVCAFEDECKVVLPRELRRIKADLQPFLDHLEAIQEDFPDDFLRYFFSEVVKMYMPKKQAKLYERLLKIQKVYKSRKKRQEKGEPERRTLDIESAKSVPIESLYDFDKMRSMTRHIMACCPFHHEKTASFCIYTDSNKFCCFGCGEKGDSIDFVMKINNLSFSDAVKRLGG